MVDVEKEAQGIVWNERNYPGQPNTFLKIKSLCAKVREEAIEEAVLCSDWRLLGECQDKGHDERWCARCEAMKDAADIIEQKIKSAAAKPKA